VATTTATTGSRAADAERRIATVTGTVLASGSVPPLRGATLVVRVLDVSYADAPSRIVAEQAIPIDHHGGEGELGRFAIDVPDVDPRAHLAVAAEIERPPGSRLPLIATTRRYPVLTHGAGTQVVLQVHRLS
jgi:uncharacterized lipoprotein YbaY